MNPYVPVCHSSDRPQWLIARRTGIGASEIAAVFGESPWTSPLALWESKTTTEYPPDAESERMRWGRLLEPVVREEYSERAGRYTAECGWLFRSTEHPWAIATLDAWTGEDAADVVRNGFPLEIKTGSAFDAHLWESGPPEHYRLQVQHQMLVTGARRASIAVLLGGQKLAWCDVERDDDTIARIVRLGSAFWERVVSRRAPEADGSDSCAAALARLYPRDNGEAIELAPELAGAVADLESARAKAAGAKEDARRAEARIKQALGPAARGHLFDGTEVSWTTVKRSAHTVAAGEYRILRVKHAKDET